MGSKIMVDVKRKMILALKSVIIVFWEN